MSYETLRKQYVEQEKQCQHLWKAGDHTRGEYGFYCYVEVCTKCTASRTIYPDGEPGR